MKAIGWCMIVGLVTGLMFATAVAYWFPVPHQAHSAWNPTKGYVIQGAGVEDGPSAR